MKIKTRTLGEKKVINEVPCTDCQKSYIHRFDREELTEHKAVVRRGDHKNGIADFMVMTDKPIADCFTPGAL